MKFSSKILSMFRRPKEEDVLNKLQYLSAIDIFRDLAPKEMEEVHKATTMTTCPAGRVFYSPREKAEVLFILKKGRVQIYRMSTEGRKIVMSTLVPGTIFGEMVLTGQGMCDAFAEAIEESLICIMSRRDLEKLLKEKPQIAVRLLDILGRRLQETEERLEQTLFHDVPSQLAALLLRLRDETKTDVIEMTHEQLAEHIGVYRETVTAALNNLRREGLISMGRKHIRLSDISALERRAND